MKNTSREGTTLDFKQSRRQKRPQIRPNSSPSHPPLTVSRQVLAPQPPDTSSQPTQSNQPEKRRTQRQNFLSRKRLLVVVIISIVVLIIVGIVIWRASIRSHPNQTAHNDAPTYQTISPDGRSIAMLGGWRRVSPPNSQPVYSYDDSIGGVSISVSQQPLPDSFATHADEKIAELAKSYNAADKLVTGDTTIYVGTSAKGPQSVIFTKNNLLVLIKSQSVVNDQAWKQYVATLVRSGANASPQY